MVCLTVVDFGRFQVVNDRCGLDPIAKHVAELVGTDGARFHLDGIGRLR